MPVQAITDVNELNTPFSQVLREQGEGPGLTPYGDRTAVLAALMQDHKQIKQGSFIVDADGAASGVEVELGFDCEVLIVFNETTLAEYKKVKALGEKFSFKRVTAGTLTLPDDTLSFKKADSSQFKGFTLIAAEATLNDVWHWVAIGL